METLPCDVSLGLFLPAPVAQVITAVFIERTHTMREYREEDELACIEYRKWVREQKKKSKRDPIIAAKLELSNVRNCVHLSNACACQTNQGMKPCKSIFPY